MTQSNIASAASLSSTGSQSPHATRPGRLGLWVMLSGTFLVVLDFFIVNVALPSMQRELQATAGPCSWWWPATASLPPRA